MKSRIIYGLLIFLSIILFYSNANAKSYAWVIDSSKAYKLDVASNKIIQTITLKEEFESSVVLQDWEDAIVADVGNNLLFVIYDRGTFMGQGVKVYNLKDLSFKKDLAITSNDPDFNLPKIIAPPVGNKFYVIWWDESKAVNFEGGETYSVYDKTTLNKISDLPSFPINLYRHYMFSSNGSKIYSIDVDTNEIKVYDSITLQLLETISIASIWGTPMYAKVVESETTFLGTGDKLLFSENLKNIETDPNNVKYFVYYFGTKTISNKIAIPGVSEKALSPDGSKIIANEIAYIYRSPQVVSEVKFLNKIHIYDIASGQRIKYFDLNDKYKGVGIMGISPDSFKLYLAGAPPQTDISTLIVIDLKDTLSIVAEIPIGGWLIFFDE